MADGTQAYSLLPWVRRGVASLIEDNPSTSFATVPLALEVNGAAVPTPPHVRLPGPGEVKSIDARAFIRTEPRPGADDFEPNFLAAVELATPDLPWIFTPSPPVGDRLTPWLCLIVLPAGDGVTLIRQANGMMAVRIDAPLNPAAELPDLSQIDAWAHAQIAGSDLSTAALEGDTGASLSRLIASRKLEASRSYVACVVPTFRAGANAGLGLPVTDGDLAPAWDGGITAPFTLPVYFQFAFQTGPGGDFASLARKISPPTGPIAAGTRTIDVSAPGFGAAPAPGVTLGLEGALRTFHMPSTDWPAGAQAPYEAELRKAVAPPAAADPVVAPPIFGKTQTGSELPASDGQAPVWLGELNLDPRNRAVAAAGGQVVQEGAQAMVASAWNQLGEIRKANQLLRQAQLAREVAASLNRRHLQAIAGDGAYLQITSPLHARVSVTLAGTRATLFGHVQASRVPDAAVSPVMRKLARPRGPLGRQLALQSPQQLVERLNIPTGSAPTGPAPAPLVVAGPVKAPQGMVALDDVSPAIQMAKMTPALAKSAPGWVKVVVDLPGGPIDTHDVSPAGPGAAPTDPTGPPGHPIPALPQPQPQPLPLPVPIVWKGDPSVPPILQTNAGTLPAPLVFPTDATALATMQQGFGAAAVTINGYLHTTQPVVPDQPPLGGVATLSPTRQQLAARLDPALTIAARLKARLPLGTGPDLLQPLTAAPKFPQAMYEPLAALSPEWMLPGISSIPIDSAVLLQPNPRFVEAYLVGLNEEFARELLWRQFPAERRETWFQYFWSRGGTPDIPAIADFDAAGQLGSHTQDAAVPGRIALLFHAELFQRYPNALVSAVQAVWNPPNAQGVSTRTLGAARQWPIFQGQIGDEYRFFGFDILDPFGVPDPAANNPGWYFVLEEHVTEPRFGLEPPGSVSAPPPGSSPSWNDMSWDHVAEGAALDGNFLTTASPPNFTAAESVGWTENAAAMAFILMRRPVRVAMHANALIAAEET
jgi:hypothetical protein